VIQFVYCCSSYIGSWKLKNITLSSPLGSVPTHACTHTEWVILTFSAHRRRPFQQLCCCSLLVRLTFMQSLLHDILICCSTEFVFNSTVSQHNSPLLLCSWDSSAGWLWEVGVQHEGPIPHNFKMAAKFVYKAHLWQHSTRRNLPGFWECCFVCARSSFKWTKSGTREFNAVMKFWESEYAML
jgi:hypothetical protein